MSDISKKMLYDLINGDRFLWTDDETGATITMEVVSCLDYQGIPYGFDRVGNTQDISPNYVYAVDVNNRVDIIPFKENYVVRAF